MSIKTTAEKLVEVSKNLRGFTTVIEDELVEFFEEFDVPLEVSLALPSKGYTASDISKGIVVFRKSSLGNVGL